MTKKTDTAYQLTAQEARTEARQSELRAQARAIAAAGYYAIDPAPREFVDLITMRGARLDRAPLAFTAYLYNCTTPRLEVWPLNSDDDYGRGAVAVLWFDNADKLAKFCQTIAPALNWRKA